MRHGLKVLVLGFGLAVAMTIVQGCAVLDQVEGSPLTAQVVTSQLTLRFAVAAEDAEARAQAIRDVVAMVRSQVDGDQAFTLAQLDTAVRLAINWQRLTTADQELLNYALVLARETLADLIGDGLLDPRGKATLGTLLTWIDNAAMRVQ